MLLANQMLAIVKSVERFHIYLYGLDFTVVTNCHILVYALNKVNINSRIARWTLKLQIYRFKIINCEGRRMAHVNALSRIVAFAEAIRKRIAIQTVTRSKIQRVVCQT